MTPLPLRWAECVTRHPRLRAPEWATAMALFRYLGNRDGKATVSLRRLQEDTRLARSTVAAALNVLEKEGLIERHRRRIRPDLHDVTEYRATFPDWYVVRQADKGSPGDRPKVVRQADSELRSRTTRRHERRRRHAEADGGVKDPTPGRDRSAGGHPDPAEEVGPPTDAPGGRRPRPHAAPVPSGPDWDDTSDF